METNNTLTYNFIELDKRALMGLLILDNLYKNLKLQVVQDKGIN